MTATQELIPGCETPILAAIDPGSTGAIVYNAPNGSVQFIKMPQSDQKGIDLYTIGEALRGCNLVLIEQESSGGFHGHTRVSDNSCFAQYKELYGFMVGREIPFYTMRPQVWQKFLGFPKKKEIEGEDGIWKDFLWDQSRQRFPGVKIPKYSADAFLIYDVLRKLWPVPREDWP